MTDAAPPLRAAIVPVTPFQQNCTLLWCTKTMRGAFVDPGGDLPKLKAAAAQHGVTVEKLILTHGHIDHAGEAKPLADDLGVPIEGPHRADEWLLDALGDSTHSFGLVGVPFTPDRWLVEGDTVTVGDLVLDTYEAPGHTPGHVIFHHPPSKLALVGDVLFAGSVGRTDFPRSNHQDLIRSVVEKLWPLGDDTAFIPGHGQPSSFGHERRHNMFVSDAALAA
ncbi:MAG: MBL fold metallo-hydrolase [Pseudomonadota bacterium]